MPTRFGRSACTIATNNSDAPLPHTTSSVENHKVLQAVPATAHCHTVDNGCCEPPLPPSVSAISPAAAADWYLQKIICDLI